MHLFAYMEGFDDRNVGLHRNGTPQPGTHSRVGVARKKPISRADARGPLRTKPKIVETAEKQIKLAQLPTGTRLLVRSRTDWRFAAVSKVADERVVLTVCSPTGRTYRLRREMDSEITFDGTIPVLLSQYDDNWHDNFGRYDSRW